MNCNNIHIFMYMKSLTDKLLLREINSYLVYCQVNLPELINLHYK
jgi:hypothetical protein